MRKALVLLALTVVGAPLRADAGQLSDRKVVAAILARNDNWLGNYVQPGDAKVIARTARQAKVLFVRRKAEDVRVATVSTRTGAILRTTKNLMPIVGSMARRQLDDPQANPVLDGLARPMVRSNGTVRLNVYSGATPGGYQEQRAAYEVRITRAGKVDGLGPVRGRRSEYIGR